MWDKILLFWIKALSISQSWVYWKNNRPKRIENSSIKKEKYEILIEILKRAEKTISYEILKKKYLRIVENEFRKDYLNYKSGNTDNLAIDEHFKYVKYLYDQEKKRQETIDNKVKHNFTIVSLIISAFAIGIPLLIFNSEIEVNFNLLSKISIVLIGVFSFLVLIISTNILNTKRYSRPEQESVLNTEFFDKKKFKTETVLTYISCLLYNMNTNNRKSFLLSWTNRLISFSMILMLLFFTLTLSSINKKEEKEIKVKISNQLELIDVSKNMIQLQNRLDTISHRLYELKINYLQQ